MKPKRTAKPILRTRQELAKRLKCGPQTISRWQEEGLPVAKRGRGGRPSRYDEAAVRAWLEARAEQAARMPDFAASRARKEIAQALEAEQRIAMRARTLIPIEEVERQWSSVVTAIRARLLALPTTLADRVQRAAATDGLTGIEQTLRAGVDQVLTELAREDVAERRT